MRTPEPAAHAKPRPRHRTIDRVAAILEFTARRPDGASLSEMAHMLDAPLSSVQGLANGLTAAGYLEERDRVYTLGPAPYFLTRLTGSAPSDVVTHDDLIEIQNRSGMTTVLAIAVGPDLYYVDHASTSPRFSYLAENHVKRSLLRASSGWALLAGMDKRDLWARLNAAGPEEASLVGRFLDALPTIHKEGIVVAPGVSSVDIEGISVPVTVNGQVVAAVACIGNHDEIVSNSERIVALLQEKAGSWRRRAANGHT